MTVLPKQVTAHAPAELLSEASSHGTGNVNDQMQALR